MENIDQLPATVGQPAEIESLRLGTRIIASMRDGVETVRHKASYYTAIGAATLGLAAGNTARTMIFSPESMAAENVPIQPSEATASKQECVEAGLAMPKVLSKPRMLHAGLRPGDPHHYHTQGITGGFMYPPLSCADEFGLVRTSRGQIQMESNDDGESKTIWRNQGPPNNPRHLGNQDGLASLTYGPTHAWPDYLFNECTDGRFKKVRVVFTNELSDEQTGKTVEEKRYILPVKVNGNCKAAQRSEQATKGLRSIWGDS